MIQILAAKVAEYLIKNEAGKIESKESYVYGIEIIMEKVFSYSALLLFDYILIYWYPVYYL